MENQSENETGVRQPADSLDGRTQEPERETRPKGIIATFRESFQRTKAGQSRRPARSGSGPLLGDRNARNRDRTKTLSVAVAGLVVVMIVFLGVFSSAPSDARRDQARRTNPSLGRPDGQGAGQARGAGSATPLLSADLNGQEPPTDQLTPDDISGTSRPRATQTGQPPAPRNVVFTDPALEAYRQHLQAARRSTPPPARAVLPAKDTAGAAPLSPPTPPSSESEALSKPSLVYVRAAVANATGAANGAGVLPGTAADPALFEQRPSWSGLPAGTRLVARLQAAASTAVKAPVVAVIEAHYERDGEIVVPAGTKAIGDLEGGHRSGYVGIRFHTLLMPDGTAQKIDAGAMSLSFGPLKGQVSGRNRGKQFLARTLTGVGTVAAFAVGRPGGFSLSGPMDNSILLRERIAQNIGIAGEQELMNLAHSQDIVVTVPGNTRFFIVLQQGTGRGGAKPGTVPAGAAPGATALASYSARPELPSAAELRELVALKQELNRMYRDLSATRTTVPAGSPER
jgi:hypothetical protein